MAPRPLSCDLLVLGSGPAGLYCALHCAGLGQKTILAEREALGGTGLRWGCLPLKMMLDRIRQPEAGGSTGPQSAILNQSAARLPGLEKKIEGRLQAAGVQILRGEGEFSEDGLFHLGESTVSAGQIVIATGSEASGWPEAPLDGRYVISHREALGLEAAPQELLVLGADVEGIELACLFAHLGSRVTVIEKEAEALPGLDRDLARPVLDHLAERGVSLRVAATVSGCCRKHGQVAIRLEGGQTLSADKVLATGLRRPNFPAGLERLGVSHDEHRITVAEDLETSRPGCFAVGDINGLSGMAHAAIQQGILVARRIAGKGAVRAAREPFPRAVYALPEIAGAGYQERELQARGVPYRSRSFAWRDTWRGFAKEVGEGFLKVLVGSRERVLGIWMCGNGASELASLFGVLLERGISVGDLYSSLILHPTLNEALLEALLELDRSSPG